MTAEPLNVTFKSMVSCMHADAKILRVLRAGCSIIAFYHILSYCFCFFGGHKQVGLIELVRNINSFLGTCMGSVDKSMMSLSMEQSGPKNCDHISHAKTLDSATRKGKTILFQFCLCLALSRNELN